MHIAAFPAEQPHGTVVLVHGLGEHSGRYLPVIEAIHRAGWSAVAYDQQGHGRSPGARGALTHAEALLDDLAGVLESQDAGGRRVLLGHSMGGAVAARFVAEERGSVDGLILSSPALKLRLGLLDRVTLAVGRRLMPNLRVGNGLDPTKISHDPEVVRAYRSDPLVHDRVTPRLVQFLVDSGRIARERAPQWRVPTLLLWAGDDHLVDAGGSREFAAHAPRNVVTARELPSLYHEIFNEREGGALGSMAEWLKRTMIAVQHRDPAPRSRRGAVSRSVR